MEIIIILLLILLNGIFSMAEMSIVTARKFKLENAKKAGSLGAGTAIELGENPTKFLSTVQIGITLIGILLGVYSGSNLTNNVEIQLIKIPFLAPHAHNVAVAIIVFIITFLSIVFGELLPKRIGQSFPEPIAMLMSRPMKFLAQVTSPFVWLLAITNDSILKLFKIKKADSTVSEAEIKSIIKESADSGEIQEIELDLVERVFELGDRKVNTLFTHKSDIVFFDSKDDWETVKKKINDENHSAYPVCNNHNIDDVVGMVLLKDLFGYSTSIEFDLKNYMRKPLFIHENAYSYKVLELFRNEKLHYGIVVDEFGNTIGIVTMDDVVDALIGDSSDFNQDEYAITQRDENSWLVDGMYSIVEFIKYFDLKIEIDYQNKFTTVGGLIMHTKSSVPNVGDKITLDDFELEVIDKDGNRIDKVMVMRKGN